MGHALELAPRPSLWAPPLYWSGRCRPSDLHVPKVLRQAVLRGRLSASDGGNACPTLRPRDFHDTGVRTGAGEPRMRTGESLLGGGRLLPSSGSRAAFGARAPVVLCGILRSSAPTSRDSRRGSRGRACMPHAAVAFPQNPSGRGGQYGPVSRAVLARPHTFPHRGSLETHGNAQNPKFVRTSFERLPLSEYPYVTPVNPQSPFSFVGVFYRFSYS